LPEPIARVTPGSVEPWQVKHVRPRASCSMSRSAEWHDEQSLENEAWVVVCPATGGTVE
jgi:hypothetical protein